MITTKKQWEVYNHSEEKVQALANELNISTIAAKICLARNLTSKEEVDALLQVNERDLHDPFLLHGMDEAVARIEEAIFNEEKGEVQSLVDYIGSMEKTLTEMLSEMQEMRKEVNLIHDNTLRAMCANRSRSMTRCTNTWA